MKFYIYQDKEMPWGDFGDILLRGFVYQEEDDENNIFIERTGPFIPLVYSYFRFLLFTETFKKRLEQSGLTGLLFKETLYKKIVNIEWDKWDFKAEEPKKYPKGGEPENYITAGKNQPELTEKMEKIWSLELDKKTLVGRTNRGDSDKAELYIIENSWTGNDIFTSEGAGYIFFTEKAKQWFEENAEGFAHFEFFNAKIASTDEVNEAIAYITPVKRKKDPYEHLTETDWKNFQKYLKKADLLIEKAKNDTNEKNKLVSIRKARECYEKAKEIRPLGKREQQKLETMLKDRK